MSLSALTSTGLQPQQAAPLADKQHLQQGHLPKLPFSTANEPNLQPTKTPTYVPSMLCLQPGGHTDVGTLTWRHMMHAMVKCVFAC